MPEGALKQNAVAIATTLSDANYQTLVHGDAKVANFCFNENFSGCAAVDFSDLVETAFLFVRLF